MVRPVLGRSHGTGRVDAQSAVEVLDQILKLVVKPPTENDRAGSLYAVLVDTGRVLAKTADKHLATLAVSFIEQTQYRLAGADEALNQISEKLKVTIEALEGVRESVNAESPGDLLTAISTDRRAGNAVRARDERPQSELDDGADRAAPQLPPDATPPARTRHGPLLLPRTGGQLPGLFPRDVQRCRDAVGGVRRGVRVESRERSTRRPRTSLTCCRRGAKCYGTWRTRSSPPFRRRTSRTRSNR